MAGYGFGTQQFPIFFVAGGSTPGGLLYFTEAQATTGVNLTVPVDSLTAVSALTNADAAFIPKGAGALLTAVPDGGATNGNKRGQYAVDLQLSRGAADRVAGANYSAVLSGQSNRVATVSQYSVTVGGAGNFVSNGQYSAIVGGQNNSTSGATGYNFIGGGFANNTTANYSAIVGGNNGRIWTGADYSHIGSGLNLTIGSASYSPVAATIGGGQNITILAGGGVVGGGTTHTINNGATSGVIGGGTNNAIAAACEYATIGGGTVNRANASRATVCGGSNNTASGDGSTASGGGNTASGTNAVAMGNGCIASGAFASIVLGQSSTASAITAVAIGGSVIADGNYSTALGQYSQAFGVGGAIAHSSGRVTTTGDVQTRSVTLFTQTTNATPTVLRTTTSAVSSSNILNNRNYTLQAIKGRCIARTPGSTVDYAVWEFAALLNRGANAASSALLAVVTPAILTSGGTGVTWALSVTADTTNGGLLVTGTGEAGKTITWGCDVNALEVQDLS